MRIFINGRVVIDSTLFEATPRDKLHGSYDGHDALAECTLQDKVRCAISLDGVPETSN